MAIIPCEICGKLHYKRPYSLRLNQHNYCSQKCLNKFLDPLGNVICANCKKQFRTNPAWIRRTPQQQRFCSKECLNQWHENHKVIGIGKDGYKHLTYQGDQIREHRVIMEQYLGRKLKTSEHIHHKNHIKTDNRIENLEILSPSEHHKLHIRPRIAGILAYCSICGKEKWLSNGYVKQKYGGDLNKVKNYRCINCIQTLKEWFRRS